MIEKITTGIIPGLPLTIGFHRFTVTAAGELAHYTGYDATADTLRAIVAPEGWPDYCKQYPEAQSIVDGLKLALAPAAVSDTPEDPAPTGPSGT